MKCAQENSCITVTGSSGVGKTATLRHVVLRMADEGYDVLLVTHPQDIVKFYNSNKKTLFVIDDFCGTYSINQSDLQNWEPVMKHIEELIQNKLTKIIVACRLQVFIDERFEFLSIFRTNICNLLSDNFSLSQTEKQLISEMYLKEDASDIVQFSHLFDCFPLLCKLYHDNSTLNLTDFFKNPFSVYETELEQLKMNKHFGKYCSLALIVMFNNNLMEELLTDNINTETKTMIENTFEACRLDKGTSRLFLLDELDSLEHTFIRNDQGVFKTVHDKLFDFFSYYFGKKMIQCLIKNACSKLIMERFLLERYDDMDPFITIVPPKYHQMYIQRMVDDLSNGEVVYVFCNKNMDNPTFRQRYLCYLKTFELSYQRKLAHTYDVTYNDTVLLQCCFKGDVPFIQWCLSHSVDVNQCRINGISPLYASSQRSHIRILEILLDNKADINKCKDDGTSPLFIACRKGYKDIVNILLDNKADIDKCTVNKTSPLFVACHNNHVDVVKLLLDNKADINKSNSNETSPLYIACQEGHVDIVKLLLDNKADINKCKDTGLSSLFIACHEKHVNIVQLLLQKKADTNKCADNKVSPLYMACQNNHLDIVKLLLDNKEDINKCTDVGASPLFYGLL